jgi:hypothetical protein
LQDTKKNVSPQHHPGRNYGKTSSAPAAIAENSPCGIILMTMRTGKTGFWPDSWTRRHAQKPVTVLFRNCGMAVAHQYR